MPIVHSEIIRARALREGFATCGFTGPFMPDHNQRRLQAFVEQGEHGTMGWMERRQAERQNPQVLWPDVKSIISLGFSYAPQSNPLNRVNDADLANISAYAWGRDYHDIVKKAAKRLASWLADEAKGQVKVFVDTAPVAEKPIAQQAGIGWQGKHTNLVNRNEGSWLFLAEIFTDFSIEPDKAADDGCGSCTRCLDVCPTKAFPTPYTLDARRCLAYLSIEHEGPIPEEFRKAMGNRIYGCDDCLSVCPWNKFASEAHETRFLQSRIRDLSLSNALSMSEEDFRKFFSGSPVKRIKWHRWIRNALICSGNAERSTWDRICSKVKSLQESKDPVIKESADWAIAQHAET